MLVSFADFAKLFLNFSEILFVALDTLVFTLFIASAGFVKLFLRFSEIPFVAFDTLAFISLHDLLTSCADFVKLFLKLSEMLFVVLVTLAFISFRLVIAISSPIVATLSAIYPHLLSPLPETLC